MSTDDRLLHVFNSIFQAQLNLGGRVKRFYLHKLKDVIRSLSEHVIRDYDEQFVEACTEVVISRTHKEFKKLASAGAFQFPANSIQPKHFDTFGFMELEQSFEDNAPYLCQLLKGLGRRDCTFPSKTARELPQSTAKFAVIGSMLLHSYTQKSNRLQMVLGLYFNSSGCPKHVIEVLASMNMSVSYPTVMNALDQLTESTLENLRELVRKCTFYILYDNINIPNRKHDQRLDNKDTFDNGTTATIVFGKQLGEQL